MTSENLNTIYPLLHAFEILRLIDALKENELRRARYQDMITVCENESERLKAAMGEY